jgi:glycosyltransferase involved in cell wall biosynthesis
MTDRPYSCKRFKLGFTKGPLFYAALNIRLFFYLLFHRADVLLANDLDTLLANYLVAKIKRIPVVYDSHEYFTEVPELQGRLSKKVWERIEAWVFPKLKSVITVNQSIADIYTKKYGNTIAVARNLPEKLLSFTPLSKEELGLNENSKYIILQGAGINIDRGSEELVEAMTLVNEAILLIVGSGDVLPLLKQKAEAMQLQNKILFIAKQSPERLKSYTYYAEIGLSLDKDTNLNYRYSLPNKIFDYMQMGVPVLASDLPVVKNVVIGNQIGRICPDHNPKTIAENINSMLNENCKANMSDSIIKASKKLHWEGQEKVINSVYSQYL